MADMYNWDKILKEDKSRRNTKNPSFSSTLLDEIYRSIDGSDEKFGEFKLHKPKVSKKQNVKSGGGDSTGGGRGRYKSSNAVEDEEIASFRRACLVDKWMEMKVNEKVSTGRRGSLPEFDRKMILDNDPMFFSSGSSSSDSSFGWYSETEAAKPKPSCFGPFNKVKTSVSPRSAVIQQQQNEFYLFDEDQTNKTDHSGLIRSKTRALKIYASLKKVKQPISPGGRLTNFLNALFPNGQSKKSKDSGVDDRKQVRTERKSKSTNVSTCSTASSFSRSCLSKNSPRSRDQLNNGMRRTVRFVPVSVVVDKDSRPCGQKNVWAEQDLEKLQWPKTEKSNLRQIPSRQNDDEEEDDDDDMASDTSSDLFELDHLSIFKNEQYYEELPVYETTHLSTNRAIASGLVC